MAQKERLNQSVTRDLDDGLDDLDQAYIDQLRESGIDEALIEQFIALSKTNKQPE